MKLEEIQNEWSVDAQIDINDLDNESLKTPKLHSKYYKMFSHENMVLKKVEADLKVLKLEKYEFYTMGATEETVQKGWKLPPKGMILRTDVPMYMDADKDIIALNLKVALQREKVDFLESIIKSFASRSFDVRNSIEFMKWRNGS